MLPHTCVPESGLLLHVLNAVLFWQVEPKVGGKFSIFGGSVIGTFAKLQVAETICIDWRFNSWQEADVSKVHFRLELSVTMMEGLPKSWCLPCVSAGSW